MAKPELDLSDWPIVVTRPAAGPVTDEELKAYMREHAARVLEREGDYVQVLDLRNDPKLTPDQRSMMGDMHDYEELVAREAGTAMVFNSALLRWMLSAVFWVKRQERAMGVFATAEEASEWGKALLAERSRKAG